jgi:ADP-ribose pyrophosphatase
LPLPPLPPTSLELLEDLTPSEQVGFLRLVRRRYRAHYVGGQVSRPFLYDAVDREALDAVVIAAYFVERGGTQVYLRSALRPPLLLRKAHPVPDPPDAVLWELPAGLVNPGEHATLSGIVRAAQRELAEELGFVVTPECLLPLGTSLFPAPGVMAERHFFYAVEVDPNQRREPLLDGSPLEQAGVIATLPLAHALELCAEGLIQDGKTELALRRLGERCP